MKAPNTRYFNIEQCSCSFGQFLHNISSGEQAAVYKKIHLETQLNVGDLTTSQH